MGYECAIRVCGPSNVFLSNSRASFEGITLTELIRKGNPARDSAMSSLSFRLVRTTSPPHIDNFKSSLVKLRINLFR